MPLMLIVQSLAEEKIATELELPEVPSYYQLGHILQSRLATMEDEFKCEILNIVQDDIINWVKNIFRFQAKTVNGMRDPRQPILKELDYIATRIFCKATP